MTQETLPPSTAAPADLRTHPRWSMPRKILAYALLFALALASIWFINRRVDHLANDATIPASPR